MDIPPIFEEVIRIGVLENIEKIFEWSKEENTKVSKRIIMQAIYKLNEILLPLGEGSSCFEFLIKYANEMRINLGLTNRKKLMQLAKNWFKDDFNNKDPESQKEQKEIRKALRKNGRCLFSIKNG